MRKVILFICLAACLFASCSGGSTGSNDVKNDSLPLLVIQVQKCSRLYTTEFLVHKVVTHEDKLKLEGSVFEKRFSINLPLGERKIAIPMNATLKGFVDFSNFSIENIRQEGDKIEIILPDPQVALTSSKIDREGVKEYVALLRSNFSDEELTAYEQQGRQAIIKTIPKMGIVERARQSAANVLIPIIEKFGYKKEDITVSFRKDLTDRDITTLSEMPQTGK